MTHFKLTLLAGTAAAFMMAALPAVAQDATTPQTPAAGDAAPPADATAAPAAPSGKHHSRHRHHRHHHHKAAAPDAGATDSAPAQ